MMNGTVLLIRKEETKMKNLLNLTLIFAFVFMTSTYYSSAGLAQYIRVKNGDRSAIMSPDGSSVIINCSANQTKVCYIYYEFPKIPGEIGPSGVYMSDDPNNPEGNGTGYINIGDLDQDNSPSGHSCEFNIYPETQTFTTYQEWFNALDD